MNIITARGVFKGLYEWGTGWSSTETEEKWRGFWSGLDRSKSTYWRHFKDGDSDYLVSTGGSVYLHPMDFTMLVRKLGTTKVRLENGGLEERFGAVDELRDLCAECAEACGGSFELRDFKVSEI